MEDIFKSIKAFLYDRATSPLFGAFVIAWSAWNYKIIAILLSDEKIGEKFDTIDKVYQPISFSICYYQISIFGQLIHGIIIPAIATYAYIYIYPLLAKPVYEYSLKKQQELRKIKQEKENNRLLSIEESRELYNMISMLETQRDKETENYRNQIRSLTETINALKEEQTNNVTNESDDTIPDSLDEYIRKKLQSLSEGDFQLSDLFDNSKWSKLSVRDIQSIGKRLKNQVERGDYLNIVVKGKGSGNQVIYTKTTKQTNETQNNKLKETQKLNTQPQVKILKNNSNEYDEFERLLQSGKFDGFISQKDFLLKNSKIRTSEVNNAAEARAFGLLEFHDSENVRLSRKGVDFLRWILLNGNN